MTTKRSIFITGGHLTPALAVIDEILNRNLTCSILFLGRKHAMEGNRDLSQEYIQLYKRKISFLPVIAGRLNRAFTFWTLFSWCKIPIGFIQSFRYIVKYRPSVIITFGGYIALPVAVSAWICGIPVVTHEQTIHMGLANRIIGYLAKEIYVSFPRTLDNIRSKKTVVTGLPIRKELFHPPQKPSFATEGNMPVLYITGGSTGASTLNAKMYPVIQDLLPVFTIIHQTGNETHGACQVKDRLSERYRNRYIFMPYFDVTDVAWIYRHAGLIIGRSGANTVWEIATLAKIAICIPLPWSAGGEQMKNALWLASSGSSVVVAQQDATPEHMLNTIHAVWSKKTMYHEAAVRLQKTMSQNGAAAVVDRLVAADLV